MAGVRNIIAPSKDLIHSDANWCAMPLHLSPSHPQGWHWQRKDFLRKTEQLAVWKSPQPMRHWKPVSTPELTQQGQSFVFLRLVESTADLSSLALPSLFAKFKSLDLLNLTYPSWMKTGLMFWYFQLFDLHIESTSTIFTMTPSWSFKLQNTSSIPGACCMLQGTYWASSPSVPPSCVVMPTKNWCTWFMIYGSWIMNNRYCI